MADAKESALRLLARREYGAFELKQRLLEKGYDSAIAEEVITLLNTLNLQSDERFVESYVRRRVAKGYGPLHIQNELLTKKIKTELIQNEMIQYGEQWIEIINQISFKKFGTFCYMQDIKKRARQIRFLQSRGFNLHQITEALSKSR